MPEVVIVVLILLMIVGSLIAIETPNMLHSVISVGAVGFLLSIVFLFLSAPDLAITQIAVEIIALVLLLRAVTGSRDEARIGRGISLAKAAAMITVLVLATFTAGVLSEFPPFGSPVMDRFSDAPSSTYVRSGLEETGAANIVTAILLDFRGYDTLGEATILFCAVMGALSVLRPHAKRLPADKDEEFKA